jgi:hypothetical protein
MLPLLNQKDKLAWDKVLLSEVEVFNFLHSRISDESLFIFPCCVREQNSKTKMDMWVNLAAFEKSNKV